MSCGPIWIGCIQEAVAWVEPMLSFRSYSRVNKIVKCSPSSMPTSTNFLKRSRKFFLSHLMWRKCRRYTTSWWFLFSQEHCVQSFGRLDRMWLATSGSCYFRIPSTSYEILFLLRHIIQLAWRHKIVLLLRSKVEQHVEVMGVILEVETVVMVIQRTRRRDLLSLLLEVWPPSIIAHHCEGNINNHFDLLMCHYSGGAIW